MTAKTVPHHIVTILSSAAGEWEALYLDGEKVEEAHQIEATHFANVINGAALPVGVVSMQYLNDDGEAWMEDEMNFPDQLSDVPEEYLA